MITVKALIREMVPPINGMTYETTHKTEVKISAIRGLKIFGDARYFCEGKTADGQWVRIFKQDNPNVKLPVFGGSQKQNYAWRENGKEIKPWVFDYGRSGYYNRAITDEILV